MKEDELNQLFERIKASFKGSLPAGTREVFNTLVKLTLEYRDELVRDKNPPLTVQEVQDALDILQQAAAAGSITKDVPARITPLITRWLAALTTKH